MYKMREVRDSECFSLILALSKKKKKGGCPLSFTKGSKPEDVEELVSAVASDL